MWTQAADLQRLPFNQKMTLPFPLWTDITLFSVFHYNLCFVNVILNFLAFSLFLYVLKEYLVFSKGESYLNILLWHLNCCRCWKPFVWYDPTCSFLCYSSWSFLVFQFLQFLPILWSLKCFTIPYVTCKHACVCVFFLFGSFSYYSDILHDNCFVCLCF